MEDMIIKGTGNSRVLRSVSDFKTLYPTYDDFAQALVDGTLPIDLAGLNQSGIAQTGTALTKENLLTNEVAALFGAGASAVPNDIFRITGNQFTSVSKRLDAHDTALGKRGDCSVAVYKYTGNGASGVNSPTTFTFPRKPSAFVLAGKYCVGICVGDTMTIACLNESSSSTNWGPVSFTWSGLTAKWWSSWPVTQANVSGTVYAIAAFYQEG